MYNQAEQLKQDTTVRAVAKCTDHHIHAQIVPAFIHLKKTVLWFQVHTEGHAADLYTTYLVLYNFLYTAIKTQDTVTILLLLLHNL